jgi:hypothetical protein
MNCRHTVQTVVVTRHSLSERICSVRSGLEQLRQHAEVGVDAAARAVWIQVHLRLLPEVIRVPTSEHLRPRGAAELEDVPVRQHNACKKTDTAF